MQNNLRYRNLSWAVVVICEDGTLPLSTIVHDGQGESEMMERYVIGYMAFWHIAFVDESRLMPCHNATLCSALYMVLHQFVIAFLLLMILLTYIFFYNRLE